MTSSRSRLARALLVLIGTAGVLGLQVGCVYAMSASFSLVHTDPEVEFSGLGQRLLLAAGWAVVGVIASVSLAGLVLRLGPAPHPVWWAMLVPVAELAVPVLLTIAPTPVPLRLAASVLAVAAVFAAGLRQRTITL